MDIIHITEFLRENLEIRGLVKESKFDAADWRKTNHTYAQSVISKLVNGEPIKLGGKGEKGTYTATPEEITKLQSLDVDYTDESRSEFDSIFNGKLKWTDIFKGQFSGYESQETGQVAESLVCYIFNEGDNADIDSWWKQVVKQDASESWNVSSIETVKFINEQSYAGYQWTNKDYVACHVDGNDYKFPNQYEFARVLTSFFKEKKLATKALGVNCNNLYSGAKDTWNKADIVLVNKKGVDILNELKKVVSDGQSLNVELLRYLSEGMIIPISLKKINDASKAKIEGYNIDDAEKTSHANIEDVIGVKVQDKFPENQYQGTLTIICQALEGESQIDFRKNTNAGNGLNVEARAGKLARAGKALANIKAALNLPKDNSYYIVKNTNDEAIRELEHYGFEPKIKSKSNYEEAEPEFRERACIAGLLGILEAYRKIKHPKIDKDFATDFANFCWLCATQGSGAFFKIYQ